MGCNKNIALSALLVVLCVVLGANAQSYEDKRCKCICPSLSSVLNNTQEKDKLMMIENVPPNMCKCEFVVLPKYADKIRGKEQEFCPRCECKYENRNTSVIKVVVVMVIWVISLLVVYMLFLILLEPLLNKRVKGNYQEHTNEDDDVTLGANDIGALAASSSGMSSAATGATGGNHAAAAAAATSAAAADYHASAGSGALPMGARGNVLNRVGHQQDKWKRQVREQRKNIYDRHTMLN